MKIQVSKKASEMLKEAIRESQYKNPALRITYAGAGWGGPKFGLALDESNTTAITPVNDFNIVVDDYVKKYLDRMPITIDYRETPYGSVFIVDTGYGC